MLLAASHYQYALYYQIDTSCIKYQTSNVILFVNPPWRVCLLIVQKSAMMHLPPLLLVLGSWWQFHARICFQLQW